MRYSTCKDNQSHSQGTHVIEGEGSLLHWLFWLSLETSLEIFLIALSIVAAFQGWCHNMHVATAGRAIVSEWKMGMFDPKILSKLPHLRSPSSKRGNGPGI